MLLLSFHLMVAIVVYLAAMPLAVRLAVLVTILSSLIYHMLRDVLLLLPHSCREILLEQNSVAIVTRNGALIQGSMVNTTVVSPFFALLRTKVAGHFVPASFVIFPDALGVGAFRELCVHLRFACNQSGRENYSQKNHSQADKVLP